MFPSLLFLHVASSFVHCKPWQEEDDLEEENSLDLGQSLANGQVIVPANTRELPAKLTSLTYRTGYHLRKGLYEPFGGSKNRILATAAAFFVNCVLHIYWWSMVIKGQIDYSYWNLLFMYPLVSFLLQDFSTAYLAQQRLRRKKEEVPCGTMGPTWCCFGLAFMRLVRPCQMPTPWTVPWLPFVVPIFFSHLWIEYSRPSRFVRLFDAKSETSKIISSTIDVNRRYLMKDKNSPTIR